MLYSILVLTFSIMISYGIICLINESKLHKLIGLSLIGHGFNLLILSCGTLNSTNTPFLTQINKSINNLHHQNINDKSDNTQILYFLFNTTHLFQNQSHFVNYHSFDKPFVNYHKFRELNIQINTSSENSKADTVSNPLPQALILTSIVISLASFAILVCKWIV